MIIRELKGEGEFSKAIDLKISCWDEELAGAAPNRLERMEELSFIMEWVNSAEENKDIRLVYGAFEGNEFMGFAGASIAEEDDCAKAVELNYLFVDERYRGRGISLKLIRKILEEFISKGFEKLVVYNHRLAPSNMFYRKFGGAVIREEIQGSQDRLQIDIFLFDANNLRENIEKVISDRYK